MKYKPILVLDFDGVCHSYTSGWEGVGVISDPPVDGLFDFLEQAGEHFSIYILSSRSAYDEGLTAMKAWFLEHGKNKNLPALQFPKEKPPAFLTIDDRSILFDGNWPDIDRLIEFKPWNKKKL